VEKIVVVAIASTARIAKSATLCSNNAPFMTYTNDADVDADADVVLVVVLLVVLVVVVVDLMVQWARLNCVIYDI